MPGPLIPGKSGVHRVACFALYRTLLRRGRQLLPPEHAELFEEQTKHAFRANAKVQGQAAVRAAFETGYRALTNLTSRTSWISRQLSESSHASRNSVQAVTKRKLPVVASDAGSQQPRHRQADTGRRWPHPDARPVLDGLASPPPGKLRRVPTLVNANHIPFLRFKKPQSPFLSYIIQEKNDEREKRIDKVEVLKKQLAIADDEDQWDRILREDHQISTKTNGIRWDSACREALMNVKRVHHTNTMKRMHIAQRMFNILQQQKELADKDRLERRDRRHQAYKARRRLREAAAAAAQDVAAKKDNPEASAAAI